MTELRIVQPSRKVPEACGRKTNGLTAQAYEEWQLNELKDPHLESVFMKYKDQKIDAWRKAEHYSPPSINSFKDFLSRTNFKQESERLEVLRLFGQYHHPRIPVGPSTKSPIPSSRTTMRSRRQPPTRLLETTIRL